MNSKTNSLQDLSLDTFTKLAHSLSIEGLDQELDRKKKELENAIELLKKSLLEFELELKEGKMDEDDLNSKIQKYYFNKILLEQLEREN